MANYTTTATATNNGYGGTGVPLSAAIMTVYSQEIFRTAMPVLMFTQVATMKEDLSVSPGRTIQFTRFSDLSNKKDSLAENVAMEREAITASSFTLSVAERGKAIAVTEMNLRTTFTNTMEEASRQLGRRYAINTDSLARDTLMTSPNVIRANDRASRSAIVSGDLMTTELIDEAVTRLAENKVPKFNGDAYVCFITPRQAKALKQDSTWENVVAYTNPENRLNGEIGRYNDVRFIVTSQVRIINTSGVVTADSTSVLDADGNAVTVADYSATVGVHQAVIVGEHALGHAVALPVEMRDDGVHDFGRERRLAYYVIDGFGLIETGHVYILETTA